MALVFALISSGILPLTPWGWWRVFRSWWRCGSSMAFLLELSAGRFPRKPALHDEQGWLSFAELEQAYLSLSCFLQQQGLVPGQQVALLAKNHRGFVLGLLALTRLGVDVLPLGWDTPEAVLEKILARQQITCLLHDGERCLSLPGLRLLALPAQLPPASFLPRSRRAGQLVVLTSGSTGVAKGIRRRPRFFQVLPLTAGLLKGLPLRRHRSMILAIPLHHGYGLATLALSLVLAAPLYLRRRYEVAGLMADSAADQPGVLVTVPTLLSRWLASGAKLQIPAAIITGSAPLESRLCQQLQACCGPIIYNLYGSSEAGVVSLAGPEQLTQAPGSVGRPLPGNQVRLEGGRIQVRGPMVLAHDWLDTGDLGRWDSWGNLYVLGRADAMVVCGGENVYPHELEEVLCSHPLVREAAVVAVSDADFGQRLVAAVVTEAAVDLMSWLRQHLERHKLPRAIYRVEMIPRNALGKVDRKALQALVSTQ